MQKIKNIQILSWIVFVCSLVYAVLYWVGSNLAEIVIWAMVIGDLIILLWIYQLSQERKIWKYLLKVFLACFVCFVGIILAVALEVDYFTYIVVLLLGFGYLMIVYYSYRLGMILVKITREGLLMWGVIIDLFSGALYCGGELMILFSNNVNYMIMGGIAGYIVASLLTAIAFARVNFETLQKHKEG